MRYIDRTGERIKDYIIDDQFVFNTRRYYALRCKCGRSIILGTKRRNNPPVCRCKNNRFYEGMVNRDYIILKFDPITIKIQCIYCGKVKMTSRSSFKRKNPKPCICTELSDIEIKTLTKSRKIIM